MFDELSKFLVCVVLGAVLIGIVFGFFIGRVFQMSCGNTEAQKLVYQMALDKCSAGDRAGCRNCITQFQHFGGNDAKAQYLSDLYLLKTKSVLPK